MKISIKDLFIAALIAIGIGGCTGFYTSLFNGLITEFFTSTHYQTSAQSDRYIFGITLAYGLLFAIASLGIIFINITKNIHIFYPLAGLVAINVAVWFRTIGGSLGSLDCGDHCVDTVVPLSAEDTATSLVIRTLIIIYTACVCLYVAGVFIRQKRLALSQKQAS